MSIDLHDPIAAGRSATEAVQRRASDAVGLARSVDLQAPADAVHHARTRANRAAKRMERQLDHASKRAAKRVRSESRRVQKVTRRPGGGRKVIIILVVLVGGAAVVAVLARRMRQVGGSDPAPDPFGTAVRATDPAPAPDGTFVTTG
jgi:exonuclease VII large subunit